MTKLKLKGKPSRLKPAATKEEEIDRCVARLSAIEEPDQLRRALQIYVPWLLNPRAKVPYKTVPGTRVITDVPTFIAIESLRVEEVLPPPKRKRGWRTVENDRAQHLADWQVYEDVQRLRHKANYCLAIRDACEELAESRKLPGQDPASRFRKAYTRHRALHNCSDKTHP